MSTICKLSPIVRRRRADRATLIHTLAQMESEAIKSGQRKLAALIIGGRDLLAKVAKSPWRTGAEKEVIFKRVAREIARA